MILTKLLRENTVKVREILEKAELTDESIEPFGRIKTVNTS